MTPTVVPPKISLYRYANGQLDIRAVRTTMGLPPSPPKKHRSPALIKAAQLFAPPAVVKATRAKANQAVNRSVLPPPPPPPPPLPPSQTKEATKPKYVAPDDDRHHFTAADDARILEWKAANEGKPWKTLAEELGKSESGLKARFKELKNPAGGAAVQMGEKPAEEGKKKEKEKEQENENEKGATNLGTGKKKESDDKTLFDSKEDELIRSLLKVKGEDEDKWLRIASRLFDKTGRDVHPEDIKDVYGKK